MCGIIGILGSNAREVLIANRMSGLMNHRGPDSVGNWHHWIADDRLLVMAHCRLSILDLSNAGSQPMVDHSGKFILTYNGEIYNYLEIKEKLKKLGASFKSQSDTEVILEAYKQWGTSCLDHFNGMFAFALYDRVRGVLFCARDRYGEKPFLFSSGKNFFVFASEYKALLQYPGISMEIDEWRLLQSAHNASTGIDADRQTLFKDVQQLLPGEAIEVNVNNLNYRIWRYWQIQPYNLRENVDEREIYLEFKELLIDSVRLRLRSDVPLGSCLSGGLDSSAIVCIVRRLLGDDVPYNTFTGRFPGTSSDEWSFAEKIVAATGVYSHYVEPTVDRFISDLPAFIWYNELPVGSSSQFGQWCVFDLAKRYGVTVLLDGQGSDEVLGGYEKYFVNYVEALKECGDYERLSKELPMIRRRYPTAIASRTHAYRDKLPFRFRHWVANRYGLGSNVLYGLQLDAALHVAKKNILPRKSGLNPLLSALEQDCFGRFLTTLLRYGDRNSMAHSREVRLPFCDFRIAEFVFSLPPHILMGEIQTKRLLREAMRGILPEIVRTRWNKQGFLPPQDLWFKSPAFISLVRETLASDSFHNNQYWDTRWWDISLDRIEKGALHLGWTIWKPFIIEQWREHFLSPLIASRQHTVKL